MIASLCDWIRRGTLPGVFLAISLLGGCDTQVEVTLAGKALIETRATYQSSIFWWSQDGLDRTTIYRHRLENAIRQNPEEALTKLAEAVSTSHQPEDVAALADLSVRYGERLESTRPGDSLAFYLLAASESFRYLGPKGAAAATNQSEIRICKCYNRATTDSVLVTQRLPGGLRAPHTVSALGRSFQLQAISGETNYDTLDYENWLDADRYQESGLKARYRAEGLGARLVATRKVRRAFPLDLHKPDEGIFDHSTAVIDFPAPIGDAPATQAVRMVLYNPIFTSTAHLNGNEWPLAADYTMPWAMLLSRTQPLAKTKWSALTHPSETSRPHRLYMMAPYSPDRIPIIMVHGLFSTPLAWQKMTSEFVGDPEVRKHYQFWHYLYPTGLPFLTTAADFRDELDDLRRILDPSGKDFALNNIVVIGHSMGGLLSHTLVSDSGDAIWKSTFAIPISEIDPSNPYLPQLRREFYFQPKPYVKRVIFLSVPHRGSPIADGSLARFVSRRVHLSSDLHKFVQSLVTTIPGLLTPDAAPLFDRGYPSSIRVLSPKATGLIALSRLPIAASTPFHSIIGDRGVGDGAKSSDGWVAYSSSHLVGAASELIVASGHDSYQNAEAIREVKRILALHLTEQRALPP